MATWASPVPGTYVLTAVATDNAGSVTASAPVAITIVDAAGGGGLSGTLGSPIFTPSAGLYGPSQPVTITAATGATIRFTTNGSQPTASSPIFTSPITLSASSTLQAKAFQDGWTPSEPATAAYEIDSTPPAISTVVAPMPNAAGWNNSAVTVRFICSDRATVDCPAPVVVEESGAGQVVSGTATDAWGQETSTSVTVNVDLAAPTVTIESPSSGGSTALSSATVTAHVSDALSGVVSAKCNDSVATISAGTVSCGVALRPGRNSVTVYAVDSAGNGFSRGLRITRVAAPTALVVTPKTRAVRVGETISLRVSSEAGLDAEGVEWSTSNPAIVSIDSSSALVMTAVSPGVTTITATLGEISADATISGGRPFIRAFIVIVSTSLRGPCRL